ncbi:MAG: hypothetical protein LBP40_07420 [Campylobacteraceae bacterium]|jgi:uncharacterized membrane protein YqiK|nr:hypothetical protein [Campylobacteraceae bacterium]
MALPIFAAGVAVGALAVAAFNNRAKIADKLQKGVKQAKKIARKELDEAFKFAEKVKDELKLQKPKRVQSRKRKTAVKQKTENKNAS